MSWEVCSLLGEESRGVDVGMRVGGNWEEWRKERLWLGCIVE